MSRKNKAGKRQLRASGNAEVSSETSFSDLEPQIEPGFEDIQDTQTIDLGVSAFAGGDDDTALDSLLDASEFSDAKTVAPMPVPPSLPESTPMNPLGGGQYETSGPVPNQFPGQAEGPLDAEQLMRLTVEVSQRSMLAMESIAKSLEQINLNSKMAIQQLDYNFKAIYALAEHFGALQDESET